MTDTIRKPRVQHFNGSWELSQLMPGDQLALSCGSHRSFVAFVSHDPVAHTRTFVEVPQSYQRGSPARALGIWETPEDVYVDYVVGIQTDLTHRRTMEVGDPEYSVYRTLIDILA